MKAAGYIRVSTSEQVTGGYSLDAQREQINAACKMKGWTLVHTFVDAGYSAGSMKRPGLQRLLAACDAKEVEIVIVGAMDRLSRRLRDLDYLREHYFNNGTALFLIREGIDCTTPTGKAMYGMTGIFAELERDLLRERTRVGMAEAKRQGHIAGVTPYGFRREGAGFVKVEEEQKLLAKAKRLRKQGLSLRQIASIMKWTLKATWCRVRLVKALS